MLYNGLPGPNEVDEERDVVTALQGRGIRTRGFWDWTLYHPADLPWHTWPKGKLPVVSVPPCLELPGPGHPDSSTPDSVPLSPDPESGYLDLRRIPFLLNHFVKAVTGPVPVRAPQSTSIPSEAWVRRSCGLGGLGLGLQPDPEPRPPVPSGHGLGPHRTAVPLVSCAAIEEALLGGPSGGCETTLCDLLGPEVVGDRYPIEGGETAGHVRLQAFLQESLHEYDALRLAVHSGARAEDVADSGPDPDAGHRSGPPADVLPKPESSVQTDCFRGCGSWLSPWLAWGALSPRVVYYAVMAAVARHESCELSHGPESNPQCTLSLGAKEGMWFSDYMHCGVGYWDALYGRKQQDAICTLLLFVSTCPFSTRRSVV